MIYREALLRLWPQYKDHIHKTGVRLIHRNPRATKNSCLVFGEPRRRPPHSKNDGRGRGIPLCEHSEQWGFRRGQGGRRALRRRGADEAKRRKRSGRKKSSTVTAVTRRFLRAPQARFVAPSISSEIVGGDRGVWGVARLCRALRGGNPP